MGDFKNLLDKGMEKLSKTFDKDSNKESNKSIACTVSDCKHHCDNNHCGLNKIKIESNVQSPVSKKQVDCRSFETEF